MNTNSLEHAQNGDGRAFADLVETHYRTVYGVAFSTVGDWSAAEDIAQETFLVAWKNLPGLRKPAAFGVWLRKIARNLSRNWLRSLSYRRQLETRQRELASAEAGPREGADSQSERKEQRAEIWGALRSLSPSLREVMVLYYLEGRSVKEVAQSLDCSPSAVKKRLERARPKLRAYFEARWEAELENERKRLQPPDAAKRFMAGVALGPVQASLGSAAAQSGLFSLWGHGLVHGELPSLIKSSVVGGLKLSSVKLAVSGSLALLIGAMAVAFMHEPEASGPDDVAPALVAKEADPIRPANEQTAALEPMTSQAEGSARQPVPISASVALAPPLAGAAVAPAKVEETVRITGRVVDESGRALPKATVTVATGLPPAPKFFGGSSGNMATPRPTFSSPLNLVHEYAWPVEADADDENSYTARCDATGGFAVDVVLDDARTVVAAWADGYMPESVSLETALTRGTDEVSIALAPCVTLNGEILSARGAPVAGATVHPTSLTWSDVSDSGAKAMGGMKSLRVSCATNDLGRFALPVSRPGLLAVRVKSATEGEAAFGGIAVEPGARVTLKYPLPASVRGRVLRSDGSPAEGCEVILSKNGSQTFAVSQTGQSGGGMGVGSGGGFGGGGGYDGGGGLGGGAIGTAGKKHTAKVSADGTYRIERLDPTQSYLASIADEEGQLLAQGVALDALTPGLTLTWNHKLQPPTVVSGVVRDASTGEPLAGIKVRCTRAMEGMPQGMTRPEIADTGADGTYELRIATGPGSYEIGPVYDRNGSFAGPADAFAQVLELEANKVAEVDFALPSPHTRLFRVVDVDGQSVPGCIVDVREHTAGNSSSWRHPEVTGADGRVTLSGLVPGVLMDCLFRQESAEYSGESLRYEAEPGEVFEEETVVVAPEAPQS
jgi:RNA polymerase sigma factor (sigma-70 family)